MARKESQNNEQQLGGGRIRASAALALVSTFSKWADLFENFLSDIHSQHWLNKTSN